MSTTTAIPRTYSGAIEALNSLQSNAATINAIRASGNKQDSVQNDHSIEYLRRIGYEVSPAAMVDGAQKAPSWVAVRTCGR